MRRFSVPLVALILTTLFASAALSAPAPGAKAPSKMGGKKHILLQWTEGDSLGQFIMTKHVTNLLDDLGQDKVDLEVISYGFSTPAVTKNGAKFADDIHKLTERGVKFRVCHHAMDFFKITDDMLLPDVKPVQGAMSEISHKYDEGYQILRP